jgi:uridine phosphorylase
MRLKMSSRVYPGPDDAIINPYKGKSSPDLGPTSVMVCSRDDMDFLCRRMNLEKEDGRKIFNSRLHVVENEVECFSMTGPFVGAPYAVMILETLIAWGARKIIVFGFCGAVSPDVKIGEIVIPTGSIIDEGTSKQYAKDECDEAYPSTQLVKQTKAELEKSNLTFHEGTIWSTDAIFRETREKVEFYQRKGILAVEMETSALFTVGSFRKVDVSALLVVSDELSSLTWRPGFKLPLFKKSRETACEVIYKLCLMI